MSIEFEDKTKKKEEPKKEEEESTPSVSDLLEAQNTAVVKFEDALNTLQAAWQAYRWGLHKAQDRMAAMQNLTLFRYYIGPYEFALREAFRSLQACEMNMSAQAMKHIDPFANQIESIHTDLGQEAWNDIAKSYPGIVDAVKKAKETK